LRIIFDVCHYFVGIRDVKGTGFCKQTIQLVAEVLPRLTEYQGTVFHDLILLYFTPKTFARIQLTVLQASAFDCRFGRSRTPFGSLRREYESNTRARASSCFGQRVGIIHFIGLRRQLVRKVDLNFSYFVFQSVYSFCVDIVFEYSGRI
jgi:hypothetical protein